MKEKLITEEMKWLKECYIAHRGYHCPISAPENSMGAFSRAVDEGFAIELDIQFTKDQEVVVFHDGHLERMTGYAKKVRDCTWDEIRSLTLLNSKEKIPLLKDVLEYIDGRVPLLSEIKNRRRVGRPERKTNELLQDYEGKFAIQSFNPYSVGWFKEHSPRIIRGQISGSFKKKQLTLYKKFLLNHLLLNHVSNPHFINYDIRYLSNLPMRIRKMKGSIILGHTAKNSKEYKNTLEEITNVVFEGFNPKKMTAGRRNCHL
ncbi:glycerophosphodiester phosphodiesterase family protein [Isachenkonia alkalipeptolytica]|uniref:glycerophosphodiester phosphodiesterase family protein n=1 Tax=Isachenkonia alkalipeptolytica TaxID=2565777 RepID=UPI00191BF5D5|nr:glycerophosphodiester phosphodiesterase family protein [Isachenkonia alkalipeptolytica]